MSLKACFTEKKNVSVFLTACYCAMTHPLATLLKLGGTIRKYLYNPRHLKATIIKVIRRKRTGFGVDGEERLALENTVDDLGAVSVSWIISICGSDLEYRRSCAETWTNMSELNWWKYSHAQICIHSHCLNILLVKE